MDTIWLPRYYDADAYDPFAAKIGNADVGGTKECSPKKGIFKKGGSKDDDCKPRLQIMASKNLDYCRRIIVCFGEGDKALGTLSGRLIDEHSVGFGTHINWVQYALEGDAGWQVGIVIANVGEPVWCRSKSRALTYSGWYALERPSCVSPPFQMDEGNFIPRNRDPAEHVACVFDDVILPLVKRDRLSVDIIAVGASSLPVTDYLQENWAFWQDHVSSIVTCCTYFPDSSQYFSNEFFLQFWRERCRNYLSGAATGGPNHPVDYVLDDDDLLFPTLSAGEVSGSAEIYLPHLYERIIDYFKMLSRNPQYKANLVAGTVAPRLSSQDNHWWFHPSAKTSPSKHADSSTSTQAQDAGNTNTGSPSKPHTQNAPRELPPLSDIGGYPKISTTDPTPKPSQADQLPRSESLDRLRPIPDTESTAKEDDDASDTAPALRGGGGTIRSYTFETEDGGDTGTLSLVSRSDDAKGDGDEDGNGDGDGHGDGHGNGDEDGDGNGGEDKAFL